MYVLHVHFTTTLIITCILTFLMKQLYMLNKSQLIQTILHTLLSNHFYRSTCTCTSCIYCPINSHTNVDIHVLPFIGSGRGKLGFVTMSILKNKFPIINSRKANYINFDSGVEKPMVILKLGFQFLKIQNWDQKDSTCGNCDYWDFKIPILDSIPNFQSPTRLVMFLQSFTMTDVREFYMHAKLWKFLLNEMGEKCKKWNFHIHFKHAISQPLANGQHLSSRVWGLKWLHIVVTLWGSQFHVKPIISCGNDKFKTFYGYIIYIHTYIHIHTS